MTVYTGYADGWQYICCCKHKDALRIFQAYNCRFSKSVDTDDNAYARQYEGTVLKRPEGFRVWQIA